MADRRNNDEYDDEEGDDEDQLLPFTPPRTAYQHVRATNVYVMDVGTASSPGARILDCIRKQETQRVCLPMTWPFAWGGGYNEWIFLKVAAAGNVDPANLNTVSLAVRVTRWGVQDPSFVCDCEGGHDPARMLQAEFAEVRRFHPVRVAYCTDGRGPYVLPRGDEATNLMAALDRGKIVESEEARRTRQNATREVVQDKYGLDTHVTKRTNMDAGKGSRKEERARASKLREAKHQAGEAFLTRRVGRAMGVSPDICCEARKCSCAYSVTVEDAEGLDRLVYYRTWFRSLSEAKRRAFVAQRVQYVAHHDGSQRKQWMLETPREMQAMVRGTNTPRVEVAGRDLRPVCTDFFCYVLGVSANKLYQPTQGSPEFQTGVPRQSMGRQSEKPGKAYYVVWWLMALATFYLHDPAADQIILPFADKRAVYDMYLHESEEPEQRAKWSPYGTASRSYFYRAWFGAKEARRIKTRKTLRFSLCPECVAFIETRRHVLDENERDDVKRKEGIHHKFVRNERGSYYCRRHQAVSDPDSCFSVIIDGADQSAFGSPHHYLHSKDDDGHWKIGTHLMGALVHGRTCHGFTFLPNIKHGSNITIETLHRVLQHEFELNEKKPFKQRVLYLQLDNTTKQCKSQFVLAYLALLVAWGVFAEVVLSFLPVGHTHEDIDQMFSRIASWLRKNNATSRIGFREAIIAGFKGKWSGKVVAGDIERAANVSDWCSASGILAPMANNTSGRGTQRDGIIKFHQFKFTLLQGVVIMQVREWCGDKDGPWRGLEPESTHHVVFSEQAPTPDDLSAHCPPAQRSTLPTNEEHVSRNAKGVITSNHTSKTRKGVEAIAANRNITGAALDDLRACLDLMESTADLEFDWDMGMYNTHNAVQHARCQAGRQPSLDVLVEQGDMSADSDADAWRPRDEDAPEDAIERDEEVSEGQDDRRRLAGEFNDVKEPPKPPDMEGFVPGEFIVGEVYLVRFEGIEWGLARCVSDIYMYLYVYIYI